MVRTIHFVEGQPTKAVTEGVEWKKKRPEGVMSRIIDGGRNQEEATAEVPLIGEIINEMIPYSLQFFMGVTEEE